MFCIKHENHVWWFELFHHYIIWSFTRANGHITLKAPVLVRSPQLSNVESGQYLDGWPPGNTRCCWLFVTRYFSENNYFFFACYRKKQTEQGNISFDATYGISFSFKSEFDLLTYFSSKILRNIFFAGKKIFQLC